VLFDKKAFQENESDIVLSAPLFYVC